MINVVDKMNSNVELDGMYVHLYKDDERIGVCAAPVLKYIITVDSRSELYTVYVSDECRFYKIGKPDYWSDAIKLIKAFEGCLLHAKTQKRTHYGININNLRFLKNQYASLPLPLSVCV